LVIESPQGLAEDTEQVKLRSTLEEAVDGEVLAEPTVSLVCGGRAANRVMLLHGGLHHGGTLMLMLMLLMLLMLLQRRHQDSVLFLLLLKRKHGDVLKLKLMLLMMLLLNFEHTGVLLMQRQSVGELLLLLERRQVLVLLIHCGRRSSLCVADALVHRELRLLGERSATV
jgi:hypothetical protein